MINKKLDEISAKLETIKVLVSDNEYLKNIEKRCDEVNTRSQQYEKHILSLEAELDLYRENNDYLNKKIDKAINYIKSQMKEEYIHTDYVYEMIKILEDNANEY